MEITELLNFLKNEGGMSRFYNRLPHVTIAEAGVEPLKLHHLTAHQHKIATGGHIIDMSTALIYCGIDQIERKYRGRSKLQEEDRFYIAETIKERFSHWSIYDVKCFADMLVECRIPTSTFAGDPVYDLPSVDVVGIMGKARVYDTMRPSRPVGDHDDNPKSMQALLEKRSTGWRKSKFNCYTDYHKTHDSDGRLVVDPRKFGGTPPDDPGWDYQSHWDKWFRTHQFAGHPAPEDFNPVAYWKTQPDVQNNMEEDLYVQSVVQKLHKANRSLEYAVNFSTITNN